MADGIIRTYDLFTAYNPGYFQLEILACDFAGHSTTTNVNIYILRDDQRVKIVFNEIPDIVRENQDEFINLLSNITGAIVNLDDIQVRRFIKESGQLLFDFFIFCDVRKTFVIYHLMQFHVDKKGRVSYDKTDMLIHVVNNQSNTILDVIRYSSPNAMNLCLQCCVTALFYTRSGSGSSPAPCCFLLCRVIKMIDENQEQLRNLFRKYNVVDVQPAVTDKLPDDITTLQVGEGRHLRQHAGCCRYFVSGASDLLFPSHS